MQIGDLVWLDKAFSDPTIKEELAVVRGINYNYSVTRYYLTIVKTGERYWSVEKFLRAVT
mgnify:FL=1|jgi:hypothetical protein